MRGGRRCSAGNWALAGPGEPANQGRAFMDAPDEGRTRPRVLDRPFHPHLQGEPKQQGGEAGPPRSPAVAALLAALAVGAVAAAVAVLAIVVPAVAVAPALGGGATRAAHGDAMPWRAQTFFCFHRFCTRQGCCCCLGERGFILQGGDAGGAGGTSRHTSRRARPPHVVPPPTSPPSPPPASRRLNSPWSWARSRRGRGAGEHAGEHAGERLRALGPGATACLNQQRELGGGS